MCKLRFVIFVGGWVIVFCTQNYQATYNFEWFVLEFMLITFCSNSKKRKNVLFVCDITFAYIGYSKILWNKTLPPFRVLFWISKEHIRRREDFQPDVFCFFIIHVHIDSSFISIQFRENFSIKSKLKHSFHLAAKSNREENKHQNVSRQQRVSNFLFKW